MFRRPEADRGLPDLDRQLEELRRLCRESGVSSRFSETTFRRFLLGRKRDVAGAHRDLVAFARWREEHGGDSLTLEDCGDYGRRRVSFLHGRDKRNRPIVVTISGRHPAYDRDLGEVRKYIILMFNQALAEADPDSETILSVCDLTAFTLGNMDYELTRIFFHVLQTFYPETLAQVLIVNAPFAFYACWAVIKPWLDPVTAEKFQFVNYEDLEKFIDKDQISPELGLSAEELADFAED